MSLRTILSLSTCSKSVPLDKIIDHIGSTHWQNLDDGIEISEAIGSQIIGFFDAVNDPDAPQSEQQQHQLQLSVPEGNFTNPNSPSLPMYNSYQPQIPRIPGAAYPGFQTYVKTFALLFCKLNNRSGFAEYPPAQMYPPAGYQQGIPMPMHLSGALATPPIYPYYYPQFGAPANHLIELQNGASTDANAPTVPFDNVVPFMPYVILKYGVLSSLTSCPQYPQSYLNYVYYQQGGSAYPQPYVSAPSSRRNSKERSAYRCRVWYCVFYQPSIIYIHSLKFRRGQYAVQAVRSQRVLLKVLERPSSAHCKQVFYLILVHLKALN